MILAGKLASLPAGEVSEVSSSTAIVGLVLSTQQKPNSTEQVWRKEVVAATGAGYTEMYQILALRSWSILSTDRKHTD